MKQTEAYQRLVEKGIRPSLQRIAIMDWLIKHPTHPTIEDVYKGLAESIPTLSKTTVYNTLRMLSEHNAAQMITIDEHRVCYDGNIKSHVHFYCKNCGKVIDFFGEPAPTVEPGRKSKETSYWKNSFTIEESALNALKKAQSHLSKRLFTNSKNNNYTTTFKTKTL